MTETERDDKLHKNRGKNKKEKRRGDPIRRAPDLCGCLYIGISKDSMRSLRPQQKEETPISLLKPRSHIETQLNSKVELSRVFASLHL